MVYWLRMSCATCSQMAWTSSTFSGKKARPPEASAMFLRALRATLALRLFQLDLFLIDGFLELLEAAHGPHFVFPAGGELCVFRLQLG